MHRSPSILLSILLLGFVFAKTAEASGCDYYLDCICKDHCYDSLHYNLGYCKAYDGYNLNCLCIDCDYQAKSGLLKAEEQLLEFEHL